jgi:hypothetical protein
MHMLRRLEALAFFGAMMLAIVLEAACVYWIWTHPDLRSPAYTPGDFVGSWMGAELVQGWLLGALLVLLYRIGAMVIRPRAWDEAQVLSNRRAFLRTWRWVITLSIVQGATFYIEQLAVH